jgi:hypothetical protein
VYNKAGVSDRRADARTRETANQQIRDRSARGQTNNVYADRDGNVHRRTENGWETRQGNNWERSGETRDANRQGASTQQRPSTTNNARQQPQQRSSHSMDRDYSARQRGNTRASRGYGGGGRRR